MILEKIKLNSFRNFKDEKYGFSPKITVIVGANASGKTNILEAIYLLAAGKSFRAKLEEEMVNYQKDLSRISGQVKSGGNLEKPSQETFLEVILTRGFLDIGNGPPEKVARKKLLVNKIPKRLLDFAGILKVVLFEPQDLDLIIGPPTLRRRFLDTVLSQMDREYRRAFYSYEKGLKQRNRLLFRIREEGLSRSQLLFWDQLLIKNGDYLSEKREAFIDFLNLSQQISDTNYQVIYDKSVISPSRLEQYAEEEIAAATTLVGPHRDDFLVEVNGKKFKAQKIRDLARYGSRGEQRMGVLWLKMAELKFIEAYFGNLGQQENKPVFLLDDIFSELDHEHRALVTKIIRNQQTIITTADEHDIEGIGKVEKIALKS